MIQEVITVENLGEHWRSLAALARAGVRDTIIDLADGVHIVEAKFEAGTMFAIFTCRLRELTAGEEADLKAACEVPEHAERVPYIGQDMLPNYRSRIVDQYPRRRVMYRWRLEEVPHGA